MRKKLLRWTLLSAVLVAAMALLVTSALGLGGVDPAPALQQPSELANTVTSQVQAPSVPSAPSVSVPSAPSVSVPSAPSTSSVTGTLSGGSRTASGSGGGGSSSGSSSSSGSGPGGSGPAASSDGSGAQGSPGGGGSSTGGPGAATSPQARQRAQVEAMRAHDRRLRREVKSMSGCLGDLPTGQRRLLGLRAGLAGPALSRGAAARRLGISLTRARGLELAGLRSLRGAARTGGCGSAGTGTSAPRPFSQLAGPGTPILRTQPAAIPSNAPALVAPAKLHERQAPASKRAPAPKAPPAETPSRAPAGPSAPAEATRSAGLTPASATASGSSRSISPTLLFVLALGLVSVGAVMFLVRRRAWLPSSAGVAAVPGTWAPVEDSAAAPAQPEPELEFEPLPVAPPPAAEPERERAPDPEPDLEFDPLPIAPLPVAASNGNGNGRSFVREHANGNGNGNGNGLVPEHANGNGNGNGNGVAAEHANGDGNGNGVPAAAAHENGNGNGNGASNGHASDRPRVAAIAASGLVSLAVSRLVRSRRRRSFYR